MGQLADKNAKNLPVGNDEIALLDSEDLLSGKPKVKKTSLTNLFSRIFSVTGKYLSTNDYDNTEKAKVAAAPTTSEMNAAIDAAINALINGAPGALNTLKELADAMADDAAFATTVTNSLALKQAITDNSLNTTAKTIVGAINELKTSKSDIPLTDQTFNGEFNLATNYEVEYNEYNSNSALTPTISASQLLNSIAAVVINAGASASLVTTNMGVQWPGNDTYTPGKQNFVAVIKRKPNSVNATGLYHIIKVLN